MEHFAEFVPEPRSVRAARLFVLDALHLPADVAADVGLLVSELAANAVLHAGTAFQVAVLQAPDELRVAVSDAGRGAPRVTRGAADERHGRGLVILETLADRWGVETGPDGKTVWFTIGLRPQPAR